MVRGIDAAVVPALAEALVKSGLPAMEVTLNEPETNALRALEALASRAAELGALAGAGTVLSVAAAARAFDAGAAFLVTPHADPDVIAWCVVRDIPVFPGALSPTEILAAWRAGASAVKLFPAASVGPDFVSQMRGPFPHIPLVPTGGISAANVGDYLRAGALATGLGGWLIGDGEPDGVEARARQVRGAVDVAMGARG